MRNVHNKSFGNDEVQKTSSCYLLSNKRNKVRKTGEQRFSGTTSSDDDTISTSVSKKQISLGIPRVRQCKPENPSSSPLNGKKGHKNRRSSKIIEWLSCKIGQGWVSNRPGKKKAAAGSAKWLRCSPNPRRHSAGSRADSKLGRRCSSRSCRSCSTAWDKALGINMDEQCHGKPEIR